MIEPNKLWQLDGGQRRRKLALTFGALERDIAGIAEKGHEYSFPSMKREEYTKKVINLSILTQLIMKYSIKAKFYIIFLKAKMR